MNERNKLFQTWLAGILSCKQFTVQKFSLKIGHDSEQWNDLDRIYLNYKRQLRMKSFLSHRFISLNYGQRKCINPFVVIIHQFRMCKSVASGESHHRKGNPLKLKDSFRRQIYERESQQPGPKVTMKSDRSIPFGFVRVDRIFYL